MEKIFKALEDGKNLFITGGGGVGKSYSLQKIREKYPKMAVTSTTGVSAININGQTVHSWARMGICDKPIGMVISRLQKDEKYLKLLRNTEILAIDEISMLNAKTFQYLSEVLKGIKQDRRPFGGTQLVLIGDFFQLPPVEGEFCFNSPLWNQLNLEVIHLTKVHRQSNEQLIKALNHIRLGGITQDEYNLFASRNISTNIPDDLLHLYALNRDADARNNYCFSKLNTKIFTYKACDRVYTKINKEYEWTVPGKIKSKADQTLYKQFDKDCRVANTIQLRKGCRVMLLVNLATDIGLANGSCGTIVDIDDSSVTVKFDNGLKETIRQETIKYSVNGREKIRRDQIPLRLAYACSIHKCVSEDTLVQIQNKGYIPIKDCEVGDYINDGQNNFNKILFKSEKLYKQGYKISTKSGFSIVVGREHPLLINDNNQQVFVKTKDLKIGTYACINRHLLNRQTENVLILPKDENYRNTHIPVNLPITPTTDLAWFVGYAIGDGCLTNKRDGRIELVSKDPSITEHIKTIITSLGLNYNIRTKNNSNCYCIYTHSRLFRDFLFVNGVHYYKAESKCVPSFIWKSKKDIIKAFLQGLFDADGYCSKHGKIVYTSKSKQLINELQILLLNFGIISYKMAATNDAQQLVLCENCVPNFYNNIGFTYKFRQNRLLNYINNILPNKTNRTNKDIIPDFKNILKSFKLKLKQQHTQGIKGLGVYAKNKYKELNVKCIFNTRTKNFSYKHLSMLKQLAQGELVDIRDMSIDKRLQDNYFYDKIVSIEPVEMCNMYDIEVENSNSFFANGFVAHNSQGMTFNNLFIDFNNIFADGQAYVALSRISNLDGLILKNFDIRKIHANPEVQKFYGL